jgi:hypothetical protein
MRLTAAHGMILLTVTAGVGTALSTASTIATAQAKSIVGHVFLTGSPSLDGASGTPGVVAMAIPQTGGDARTAVSGADGTYAFEDLPDDVYRIDFYLPGFDLTRRNLVAVRAGETAQVDVTLQVGQVTAMCECLDRWGRLGLTKPRLTPQLGQVVDAVGRPLPHAQLEIIGPVGPETVYASREGRFQVRLSPDQTWPLTARDSGFGAVTMNVSGATGAALLFRLPNADTRLLPAVERLRRPCCPGDLFANLGP